MNAAANKTNTSKHTPSNFEEMEAYRQGLHDARFLPDSYGYPQEFESCEILKEAYDCGWEDAS